MRLVATVYPSLIICPLPLPYTPSYSLRSPFSCPDFCLGAVRVLYPFQFVFHCFSVRPLSYQISLFLMTERTFKPPPPSSPPSILVPFPLILPPSSLSFPLSVAFCFRTVQMLDSPASWVHELYCYSKSGSSICCFKPRKLFFP